MATGESNDHVIDNALTSDTYRQWPLEYQMVTYPMTSREGQDRAPDTLMEISHKTIKNRGSVANIKWHTWAKWHIEWSCG